MLQVEWDHGGAPGGWPRLGCALALRGAGDDDELAVQGEGELQSVAVPDGHARGAGEAAVFVIEADAASSGRSTSERG